MARILHTADWHVGRDVLRVDRAEDFQDVLAQIVQHAEASQPDLILHCGDVFDTPRPGVEDMKLVISTLQRLSAIAPTLVLAGNHDSPQLLELFNALRSGDDRLRFVSHARPPAQGGIIDIATQDGERIRLAPVPFVHANRQVDLFDDPQRFLGRYAERLAHINRVLADGLRDGYDPERDVLVYAAHLYVTGAHISRSERPLHVTDVYATQEQDLPPVAYAALGHIHKAQDLPGTTPGRYVGSPMQLDFGEAGEQKSLALVELRPSRPARVELLPMDAGRHLRQLRGTLEQLAEWSPDVHQEIVKVIVDCEEPIGELSERVRELFPHATFADIAQAASSQRLQALTDEQPSDPSSALGVSGLLDEYLTERGTSGPPASVVRELYAHLDAGWEADGELADHMPGVRELLKAPLPAVPAPAGAVA